MSSKSEDEAAQNSLKMAQKVLSPLDGRYSSQTNELALIFCGNEYLKWKLQIECAWVCKMVQILEIQYLFNFDSTDVSTLLKILGEFQEEDFNEVVAIEAQTKHDTKAVEKFLIGKFREKQITLFCPDYVKTGLARLCNLIHFGLTSEDVSNSAYGIMISRGIRVLTVHLEMILCQLESRAQHWADISLLGMTHGQPASPTTLGKEFAVFYSRLHRQINKYLAEVMPSIKWSGAVGNFSAFCVAKPHVDWKEHCRRFVEDDLSNLVHRSHSDMKRGDKDSQLFNFNLYSTQIECHDWLAELFHILIRINSILTDLARDIWLYTSRGIFELERSDSQIGSSTMPHKVNPIDFENAEGNLGLSNALLSHMAQDLTVSRLQRDLSDSTVLRSVGSAFGYSLISYKSLIRGIDKLKPNRSAIQKELSEHWEVMAEPFQTALRLSSCEDPYELMRQFTQGRQFDKPDAFKELLESESFKVELWSSGCLKSLKELVSSDDPGIYRGLAVSLARGVKKNVI